MTSTLKTNAIEPEGATTNMVVGESGQNTVISNNDLRANVLQDAGGNAVFTSNGSGVLSGVNSAFGSAMVLISSQTASSSASISFTSGITSSFGEYIFKFYTLHPSVDNVDFLFQVNASGESGYNETITSSSFRAEHNENDYAAYMAYHPDSDQAQGTAYQNIMQDTGADNDHGCAGELHLFNPASTTYAKLFYSRMTATSAADEEKDHYRAGYINTTAAITQISFKMESGNIDAGKIKMFGVK